MVDAMGTGQGLARRTVGGVVATALAALAVLAPGSAHAGGITNAGSDARTGWYPREPALRPSTVGDATFGRLWATPVKGQVYAQPLVVGGRVVVATEANQVVSLDAARGRPQWATDLGGPWNPADLPGCTDLTPSIGVTATPVIDPASNTVYLTHKTYANGGSAWLLDALDLTTGDERPGFPVALTGTADNVPGFAFDPTMHLQRPGLLLLDGVVYAAFGSHCGLPTHQGWVFGIGTDGAIRARWVTTDQGSGAGIWQTGSGLMSDGPGRIFFATGNGWSPPSPLPGGADTGNRYGDSVVRLGVLPDGRLQAQDFFAPFDAVIMDWFNGDMGSGGVVALPGQPFGSASYPHVAVAGGKPGYLYLLNRDHLGGIAQGPGGGDDVLATAGPIGAIFSRTGVWPGNGGWVYVVTSTTGPTWPNGGEGQLHAFAVGHDAGGRPTLSEQGKAAGPFGFSSGAPVVTSAGARPGTAVLWTIWSPGGSGAGAELRAYDPVPRDGILRLRWQAPIGTAAKFSTPGVGGGRLVVGTRDGHVIAFGRRTARRAAKLRLSRPSPRRDGRLLVRGGLTRLAGGSVRIIARVRTRDGRTRTVKARARIHAGRFRATLRLPRGSRRARVTVAYPGSTRVRPQQRTRTVAL